MLVCEGVLVGVWGSVCVLTGVGGGEAYLGGPHCGRELDGLEPAGRH